MTLFWHELKCGAADLLAQSRGGDLRLPLPAAPLRPARVGLRRRRQRTEFRSRPTSSPGLIGYAVANTALGGLAITLVIRREYGILKRLRSTPLPASLYLAATLLSNLLVVVLQSFVVVALGLGLFDAQLPENWLSFLLALGLGAASFAGLGLAIAALVRSGEAIAAVVNVIVLPMAFLSGVVRAGRRAARGPRGCSADVLPLHYLLELVYAGYVDGDAIWEHPTAIAVLIGLGRRGLPRRAAPLRLGAARTLEELRRGVPPLAMQEIAPIAFVDDDGDIRVNFGMFAGREATRAEIDELANDAPGRGRGDHDRRRAAHGRRPRDGGIGAPDPDRAGRGQRPAAPAPDHGAVGRGVRRGAARGDHGDVSTLRRMAAAPISATSPSSRTSTTARRRSSTRCSGSPAPSARTRTSTSACSTRWTSSGRRGSRSSPRTRPSATARRRSTSSTRRATPTSAARSSAG